VIESGPVDLMLARPRTEDARRFIAGQLLL
jgi:hypothetical protein